MNDNATVVKYVDEKRCDVLLFYATDSEEKMLKEAAKALHIPIENRKVKIPSGETFEFLTLDKVGSNRVNAIQTEMGPFFYGGSASRAISYRALTGATAIIQIGMAFGVDPKKQKPGDILVATSVIPYDLRTVRSSWSDSVAYPAWVDTDKQKKDDENSCITRVNQPLSRIIRRIRYTVGYCFALVRHGYVVDYAKATKHSAKESLVHMLQEEYEQGHHDFQVFFGGMLSGAALIFSRCFVRELIKGVPQPNDGVIGGEMEGVGLLSVSPKEAPVWCVVKGISDFGDENRNKVIQSSRPLACRNSAHFVLSALKNWRPEAQ